MILAIFSTFVVLPTSFLTLSKKMVQNDRKL